MAILEKHSERMVAFYDFPKEHWKHLRTTDVVESPFAAVRLRTDAAKRFKKTENATVMIWRLLLVAEKRFRKINAPHLAAEVYRSVMFEVRSETDEADSEDRRLRTFTQLLTQAHAGKTLARQVSPHQPATTGRQTNRSARNRSALPIDSDPHTPQCRETNERRATGCPSSSS